MSLQSRVLPTPGLTQRTTLMFIWYYSMKYRFTLLTYLLGRRGPWIKNCMVNHNCTPPHTHTHLAQQWTILAELHLNFWPAGLLLLPHPSVDGCQAHCRSCPPHPETQYLHIQTCNLVNRCLFPQNATRVHCIFCNKPELLLFELLISWCNSQNEPLWPKH